MSGVYDRYSYFSSDGSGNDPLTSKLLGKLPSIPIVAYHTVNAAEECRADNLALKLLGSASLWWILLEYNSLTSVNDLRAGLVLKIPDRKSLTDVLVRSKGVKQSNRTILVK